HVHVAVAVEVHGMAVNGTRGLVVNHVLLPGLRRRLARILVPDGEVGRARSAEQVDSTVAVEVGGPDGAVLGRVGVDDVLGPLLAVLGRAVVLEPDELVALAPAGSGHVEVAVAVQVRQGNVVSARQSPFADDEALPELTVPWRAA